MLKSECGGVALDLVWRSRPARACGRLRARGSARLCKSLAPRTEAFCVCGFRQAQLRSSEGHSGACYLVVDSGRALTLFPAHGSLCEGLVPAISRAYRSNRFADKSVLGPRQVSFGSGIRDLSADSKVPRGSIVLLDVQGKHVALLERPS